MTWPPALPLLLCIRRYGVGHVVYCPTGERVSEQEDCRWSATGHGQCQIEVVLVPCRALPRYRAVQYSTQARRQLVLRPGSQSTWVLLLHEAMQSTPLHIETQSKPASEPVRLEGRSASK